MATADQTLYNSRGFQPNFIRGIVRNPMRAVNNTSATPHFKTIQEAIEHDHHVIKAHYQAIATSKDHDEQTRYQNQLTWEMARHVVGEELVLFPAFEKYLKDGGESSVKNRQQHDTVFPPPPLFVYETFQSTLNSLMDDFTRHTDEVETNELPKLNAVVSREENAMLSVQFDRTKMFGPSRAHPGAPSKPPFENVSALLTAPVDRLVDLFRKWPEDTDVGGKVYVPPK
ncbi:hypothetical protein MPDQ_000786 [Monascus purpureus]|uniref:Hemerythrin-like domain-containing protein n=1 Tax=Monascus purpureus TaxID=5098 RepID=A0A507QQS1_MONPU|nr:hypothetical protein MPDQ_000786 [Monascus purpureus]